MYIYIYIHAHYMQQFFIEKLTGSQLVKKFSIFYGTRSFITAFTSALHLSPFWASSIQYTTPKLHFLKTHFNIILHLRQGLPSGLFPPGFPTKTTYSPILSPLSATCSTHLILYFINRTILGEHYRSLSSSSCNYLHSLVTLPLLYPNIYIYIYVCVCVCVCV